MDEKFPAAGAQLHNASSMLKVDYSFIDVEYRYGLAQMTDALTFLHVSCRYVHRNICPNSVYVTKSGTWKLAGLEFMEKLGEIDSDEVPCQPWTTRMPKFAQPDLNYIAPEIQHKSQCSISSDMFSLGMLMVAVFNGGQSLIQANHSTNLYFKQAGVVSNKVVIHIYCPKYCLSLYGYTGHFQPKLVVENAPLYYRFWITTTIIKLLSTLDN